MGVFLVVLFGLKKKKIQKLYKDYTNQSTRPQDGCPSIQVLCRKISNDKCRTSTQEEGLLRTSRKLPSKFHCKGFP